MVYIPPRQEVKVVFTTLNHLETTLNELSSESYHIGDINYQLNPDVTMTVTLVAYKDMSFFD